MASQSKGIIDLDKEFLFLELFALGTISTLGDVTQKEMSSKRMVIYNI